MKKVLVLGAGGMLGHKMFQRFPTRFETIGTVREITPGLRELQKISGGTLVSGVDADVPESVATALRKAEPDVIVNCIGVIKQRPDQDEARSMYLNAEFPHELTRLGADLGAMVIHISTDCVFSGDRGHYTEDDTPDPVDSYGRSKLLGEDTAANALTIRTSMVGRELSGFHSLIEWFLRQPRGETVQGFSRASFSGMTTIALSDEIARVITDVADLHGLYHVSADPISKHELLQLVRDAFGLDTRIAENATFHCDRTLISRRYREATGFVPMSWPAMIRQLAEDPTPYGRLQR